MAITLKHRAQTRGCDMGYAAPRTTYKFSGLSPAAQEHALEALWDINVDFDWWDSYYDDFASIGEILGIDLNQKTVRLMGGGARLDPEIWFDRLDGNGSLSYRAYWIYKPGSTKAIKAYAPQDAALHRIAKSLQLLSKRCFYQVSASVTPTNRDRDVSVNVEQDEGYELPEGVCDGIVEALENFGHWMFRQLRLQYEYLTGAEAIRETIEANDYDFDAEGNLV